MFYLGHLLLLLVLRLVGVRVMIRLDHEQIVTLGVDHKLTRRVLQRCGHLIENRAQLLQRQNPVRRERERKKENSGNATGSGTQLVQLG